MTCYLYICDGCAWKDKVACHACVHHCHVFRNLQLCSGIICVCYGVLFWFWWWLIVALVLCVTVKNSGIIVSFIKEESVSVASDYRGGVQSVLAR